jgi:lysozyme family protein
MNFDAAFEKLIGHEGGYSNNPADPGGETKYGISKRVYPAEDITNLTLDRAKALYLRDYWGPAGCDAMPDAAKFHVFDMAVNSGVRRTILAVQKVVSEVEDGVLGPRTLQAIQSMPSSRFVAWLNAERLLLMADLKTWPAFGRGWAKRIAVNLKEA